MNIDTPQPSEEPLAGDMTPVTGPEWQTKALWDLKHTSLSYAEIGRKYGRARDTIVKLKNREKIIRPPKAKSGPRPVLGDQFISPQHRALATSINLYSDQHPNIVMTEVLGVSPQVLKRLKHGCHDAPLTLLLRISEVLGESLMYLLDPKKVSAKPKG